MQHLTYDEFKSRMFNLLGKSVPTTIKNNFKWDDVGVLSFTKLDISKQIAQKILELPQISKDSIITDAMSGIGGNTIAFAQTFKRVNAVELNRACKEMLVHNLDIFNITNVVIYRGYFQEVMRVLHQDVVFIDAPWGLDYKEYSELTISVKNENGKLTRLEKIIINLAKKTKYAVVKLPINYDMDYFETATFSVADIIDTVNYPAPNSMKIVYLKYI
jgi:16S rRNA G966 N2-methylase RsmD